MHVESVRENPRITQDAINTSNQNGLIQIL